MFVVNILSLYSFFAFVLLKNCMLCSLFFIIDIIFENDLYAFEFSEIALRQF